MKHLLLNAVLKSKYKDAFLKTHEQDERVFKEGNADLIFLRNNFKRQVIRRYYALHHAQVTSFGGAGTTTLCKFLKSQKVHLPAICEGDWAPWKHMKHPPLDNTVCPEFRALYLVGNPMDAVLSVFRRCYQHCHVQRMEGEVKEWNFAWALDDFIAQEHDYFQMEVQFDNWLNAKRRYPIMVIKFDAIWDHLPELFDFFGIEHSEIGSFPAKKSRHSAWQDESPSTQRILEKLYGSLARKIDQLPPMMIIEPSEG